MREYRIKSSKFKGQTMRDGQMIYNRSDKLIKSSTAANLLKNYWLMSFYDYDYN